MKETPQTQNGSPSGSKPENDWWVRQWLDTIEWHKESMVTCEVEYIVPLLKKRDLSDEDEKVDINMELTEIRWSIEERAKRIKEYREAIDARRKKLKGIAAERKSDYDRRIQDCKQSGIVGRDRIEEGPGGTSHERPTLVGESGRRVPTGRADFHQRADEARENTFRADVDG